MSISVPLCSDSVLILTWWYLCSKTFIY